jgi:hypothetical protein
VVQLWKDDLEAIIVKAKGEGISSLAVGRIIPAS